MDARRKAAAARTPEARIAAFEAADLRRALQRLIDRVVAGWPDTRDSARRALRTELEDRAAPYTQALDDLAARAGIVGSSDKSARSDAWRSWTMQLITTFAAADRTWSALRSVVEATRR